MPEPGPAMHRRSTSILLVGLAALVVAACGDDANGEPVIDPGDGGNYAPTIEAANFVDGIDNPFLR